MAEVDFSYSYVKCCNFAYATLSHANLEGTKFVLCDFRYANLQGAHMKDTIFQLCDLYGALLPDNDCYYEWCRLLNTSGILRHKNPFYFIHEQVNPIVLYTTSCDYIFTVHYNERPTKLVKPDDIERVTFDGRVFIDD